MSFFSSQPIKSKEFTLDPNFSSQSLQTESTHDSLRRKRQKLSRDDAAVTEGMATAGNQTVGSNSYVSDVHYGRRGLILAQVVLLSALIICLMIGSEYHSILYKRINQKQLLKLRRQTIRDIEATTKVIKNTTATVPSDNDLNNDAHSGNEFNAHEFSLMASPSSFLDKVSFFVRKGDKAPVTLFDPTSSILACAEHDILSISQFVGFLNFYLVKKPMSLFITCIFSASSYFSNKTSLNLTFDEDKEDTLAASDNLAYSHTFLDKEGPPIVERLLLPQMKKHLSATFNQHLMRYSFSDTSRYNNTCPRHIGTSGVAKDQNMLSQVGTCKIKKHLHNLAPSKLNLSYADLHNILNVHSEALRTLTGGLLYRAYEQHWRGKSVSEENYKYIPAYDIDLLRHLNLFFHEGGFLSPCYPFNRLLRWFLNGWFGFFPYGIILVGWLPSLFSTHPITLVHFPRLTFYFGLAIYRALILYTGGNILEYVLRSPYDYSDHIVLYMLFLLIASIEWSAVARTQVEGSHWIIIVRIYYAVVAVSMLYLSAYTSMFFHDYIEIWLGFLVGLIGLFGVFWLLVSIQKPSLSRIGILKGRRRESVYSRTYSNDKRT